MQRFSLHFTDPAAEAKFRRDHLTEIRRLVQISMLIGTFLYALFGVLDYYIVPAQAALFWKIRYLIVSPLLVALIGLTRTEFFMRNSFPILMSSILLSAGSVIIMIAIADQSGSELYFSGLSLIILYGSTLLGLRFTQSIPLMSGLVIGYEAVLFLINPVPLPIIINNNFFIGITLAFSAFCAYILDYYIRKNYAQKARSDDLLVEARAGSKAKSEFLAVMSHELRTPLNAIIGFAEMMNAQMFGPVGSARYVEYVRDIHFSSRHLLTLINDIIDLSRAEVNKLTLEEEELDLPDILNPCARMFLEKAAEQGVRLSATIPSSLPRLRADLRLMTQLLINLISNAVKFTPQGGSVAIDLSCTADDKIAFTIADTGIGIAQSDLKRIFLPFVQVESAFARKNDGLGIGLNYVEKIVNLHDAEINISSIVGGGTTIVIKFPPERTVRSSTPTQLDDHRQ